MLAPDGPEVRAMVLTTAPPDAPSGIEVRRVETFDDFLASRDVQWDAFDVPQERRELQKQHLRSDFDESMQHQVPVGFLAYLDGKPAATGLAIPSAAGRLPDRRLDRAAGHAAAASIARSSAPAGTTPSRAARPRSSPRRWPTRRTRS